MPILSLGGGRAGIRQQGGLPLSADLPVCGLPAHAHRKQSSKRSGQA